MYKLLALVFSFIGLLGYSAGQIIQNGQCDPNIEIQTGFEINEFLGTWYEITRANNPYQESDCSRIEFTNNNNIISINNEAVKENFFEGVTGTVTAQDGARLTLSLPSVSANPVNFWVLMTDYQNYAVGYSCVNIGTTQRSVYIWNLGRATSYPTDLTSALINNLLIRLLDIQISDLQQVSHSEDACYLLPELQPGQPVVIPGQCNPDIPVVQNFNVANFLGTWHEISRYQTESQGGGCNRAQYSLGNNVVDVLNSQVNNQALDTITGYASVISTDGSAKLGVVLDIAPGVTAEQELWVVATDYTGYAVLYSCDNLPNNEKRVYSWISSRTRQLSAASESAVTQVINSILELNNRYYQQTDQSDNACFYYPEPVPGQQVVFRGQCDMNIPVVQNFDAARYLGLWHDIESYPTVFQTGTCNNALYSINGDVVDVYNTQVLNERLDFIHGQAVVASDDGSARLRVTFPVAGTDTSITTDYWVLATDYDSYSLVYTCQNLDNDERLVWSWKLSRDKQLSVNSATAINNVISNIPVLDNRYFQARDQSSQGCFYYPTPEIGLPVVFPGQCDENLQVVLNFNIAQFSGTWHEIEAYPKEEQQGQCINHEYTVGTGNTLNLQSSSVIDQFLDLTTGSVSFSGTDGSAKLTISFTSNNQLIQIPFWILNTDYTDYALAYSCVNLNSTFQGVWSWKLSRSRQLSAAANTVINTAISSVLVLDQPYFEPIDQTDQACFYLPELEPGEPVVLVGQCDPNIQVVQNFDAQRYMGRWRLLESYPSDFQSGTCNDATYTLVGSTVNVFNTQVINQALDTITGSATLATTDGSAKLLVDFPGADGLSEYWVLATDYDSYALVYSCQNINAQQRRVWSWKMSRTNQLTAAANTAINQVLNNVEVLNNRYYDTIDHSDNGCFYYPEANGQPVIFRGQCDMTIPAVANFDAARYLGLWYDLESYPSAFQGGSCNTALYQLNDGVVDVYNTEVVNERLEYMHGTAVVASTDGTGKLEVTFPIMGTNQFVSTDYWILATDYDSYSFVYTCLNINEEQRQVWSWKLSRNKQLSNAANTAINNVINTVPVLRADYYETRDHSESGCFYNPDPEPGLPVVFPGQCDNNIQAIPNFNMAQFQGTWHEIEAYPKEQESGQCINHQFSSGTAANTLNLVSSNVLNQFLDTTNSVVSFTSTDSSGRLQITLTQDNQVIEIPYWILNTDYTNYALAYSCMNLNATHRGVWSWKLSRTRQLSAAANTAISNTIASIEVLNDVYYEPIDQSDTACFYLPDLGPNEPVVINGQCDPNIPVVQNFDAARYLGRWRMIETYFSDFQDGSCNDATYSLDSTGTTVLVYNTQVINQQLDTINGTAVVSSTDGSAKLLVSFPGAPELSEYWVLATDYDSYALVYSCSNLNSDQRRVWSWKMSRTRELTAAAVTAINTVVDSIDVLNSRYYNTIDQSDNGCFYYPIPNGSPVIFRGQCDPNVATVTNFDAARYLGLWYDLSSYPSVFQGGSCNTAFYSLNGGVVDVYNTQVIGERLDFLHGVAIVASTDGTGKLEVTFPIVGTTQFITTDYWILATDYDSYSLVYTCVNINSEERQVWSWKLGRQKQFTAAATTAMNNVINNVPVLDQQYYEDNDHSEDGCFYNPDPEPGLPVVFPGQCDASIPVVNNFNMAQFQGTWYEIRAYPKEEESGQCINHQYATGNTANTLNLQSSSVTNQLLDATNSLVTFTSTDSSARLLITLTQGNEIIEIPYWILSTDYNNYALAYSCVNFNSTHRGVWSWQLSREKQLSAASTTAINTVISSIDVLNDIYYETIDQSDSACFYLPELGPNDPVTFAGQCDPNIPVVQNFDAARYLGRWRMIETYASDFQDGSCNDATYSLGDGGTVLVYNTQVINQELDTINGTAVLATTDGSGKLLVSFPGAPELSEYWILATDYDSYALVYSCANLNSDRRRVWSWKMSRTSQLTAAATTAINQVVNTINVLDSRYYNIIDQSDAGCFYYPEPNNQPVIFRGQCDMSIPAVANFDAARYLGLWYDLESYPSVFQDGSCSTALYQLNGGVVDVYNTQVIDERLDVMYGTAVVSATDGTGKLEVTFPIAGTNQFITTDYWILATDYDTYSLVYSCVNINAEERQVWSWKLGRQKQFTAAATTAMNNVINSVQVLGPQYYQSNDHSADGCFYYPDPVPDQPVVFPGQCDENIPVVNNFNMANFQGIWHEIQAYPKEEESGQCINHQFSTGTAANTLNLQSLGVTNQLLGTTNSIVSFTSTDSSAKLQITLTQGNNVIVIPYWVLNTDYTDYALAYSCVNTNTTHRGVWSWKLSRTKQLSAAANTAISNAMTSIDVLNNVYYENIDQSDSACFYLPVLGPTDPVVFVGQCDPNIPVVQNFDAGRYLGRWRMIQSYESDFQDGSCNDASYSLDNDGTVLVYNTQVINEALDTINGTAVVASTDGSAKLLVSFPGAPELSDYWVLATDYDSYALVYSCANLNSEQRRVWSWKLSRTRELTPAATTAINQAISTVNVLDNQYYNILDHSDSGCFYYPEPNGLPVVFRGQCDESIPVVTNFDAERYMGLWYDIQSYPQFFQDGTCPTATYSLGGDGVIVYNTQVVNQQLDDIYGSAVLATTDGSAKLTVSFPIAGTDILTESPYWVLSTDYDTYSFVYSCSNIDDEYRSVSAWKLSRQRTLSQAAQTTINNIMNTIPILREQYYTARGHTDDDCFYYPDNLGGPVILDGQCEADAQIQAIQGFNINAFAGTWHEVSRFPSELQTGQCAASDLLVSNQNTFSITQSIIDNESLNTAVLTGVPSSDGRGIINVNENGVPTSRNLYILDTDYSEFALIYSCREIDTTSKQVYSWKLSRTRSGLSAAANDRISQLVSSNEDLFELYYDDTDQSSDGCFYYPEFDELPAAIDLPGPCPTNIVGQANFNVNAFLGRWFEIARYPQPSLEGQCGQETYSVGNNGVLNVVNTLVDNQILNTIQANATFASNDGSAVFEVSSDASAEILNYYVLGTDYTNYALVYSCRNLDNGDSRVASSKLSRTRTLSAASTAAIDNVIANTRGLLQNYYLDTSHTVEDCFYIPEVDAEQAPLFRGQCGDITGVPNFDMQRYAGWWHEIERYASDEDVGECISSRYQQSGNQYLVVETNVFNNIAQVTSDTVQVTNDGRLRRTLSNGEFYDTWVLTTDYETYSLLYSCQNVGDEYRRVWSAKHSKTKELSQEAQDAMAPIIESNELLYDQFYFRVNQSDSACFHYPEQTGQQIILPGQCDLDIPVVQNFDAIEYSGTWYQIERYPQIHESGTCIGARYTPDEETGEVNVLNWEVIDGVLSTIEGTATVVSTDGSAKLSVILPVVGSEDEWVTTSLYVLRTDYVSYSLAYSCVNVNDFERAVGAWKLSRHRTMPDSGVVAINEYMATREELYQDYFIQIEQSEECEEPSSALLVKSSIIVLLVCAVLHLLL